MLLTRSRNLLPLPMRREKKVKLSKTYFSVAPAGTGFASRRDSRYLARIVALVSVTRLEEHTSELQSRLHLVCRLLLEKKNPVLDSCRPGVCLPQAVQ